MTQLFNGQQVRRHRPLRAQHTLRPWRYLFGRIPESGGLPVWVKLRRTQYEQMSSAVDPTADIAPLANIGSSGRRESSRGEIVPTPIRSPATHRIFTVRDEIWERWTVCSTWMGYIPENPERSQRLESGALHLIRSISSVVVAVRRLAASKSDLTAS